MTAITEQDVERVARAICRCDWRAGIPEATLDKLVDDNWEEHTPTARAALEAFLAGRQEAGPVGEDQAYIVAYPHDAPSTYTQLLVGPVPYPAAHPSPVRGPTGIRDVEQLMELGRVVSTTGRPFVMVDPPDNLRSLPSPEVVTIPAAELARLKDAEERLNNILSDADDARWD